MHRRRFAHSVRGLTLLELLVVMALISLLAGIGVGMMQRGDSIIVLEGTTRQVRANLRTARNSARATGAGSIVRIWPQEFLVEVWPGAVGGNWHLEDSTGSRGTTIEVGAEIVEDGYLGRCARFGGGGQIELGRQPFFLAPNGFRFSLMINVDEMSTTDLVTFPGMFRVTLLQDGGIMGTVEVGDEHLAVILRTRKNLIRPGRWNRIELVYDRLEVALDINGVRYAKKKETLPVSMPEGDLKVGGGSSEFKGRIDEIRYDVVAGGESEELAGRVDFLPGSDLVVRFDGSGRLDSRFHQGPVTIRMMADADETMIETIRVEMSGIIR